MRTAKSKFQKMKRGWYWSLHASNGKKVAHGGEPFSSLPKAKASVTAFLRNTHLMDHKDFPFDVRK